MEISKSELEEFYNIQKNQPVFAGNTINSNDTKSLMDKGLVMRYEGEYVLTEKGKQLYESFIESAKKLAKSTILRK